jgi:hypothetical protein
MRGSALVLCVVLLALGSYLLAPLPRVRTCIRLQIAIYHKPQMIRKKTQMRGFAADNRQSGLSAAAGVFDCMPWATR